MTTKEQSVANKLSVISVTIAASGTTSSAIDAGGMSLVGIVTPSELTSTAITLLASADGTNYAPVYNASGTQISATVATNAARFVAFTPSDFVSFQFFKLVCGSNEASQRTIKCVFRAL